MPLQFSDTFHHAMMSRGAFARFSMSIVKKRRTVHADADVDLMSLEKIAPRVVDQYAVGLERMPNPQAAGIVRADNFNRAFIVGRRKDHRLARVPHHGEAILDDSA